MKAVIDVAVVQFEPRPLEVAANVEHMAAAVRAQAAHAPTDLIVFPELASTGYVASTFSEPFSRRLAEASDTIPGELTEILGAAARDAGAYVATGLSERGDDGKLFNSMVLISPAGDIAGLHRKVHLYGEELAYFTPGDSFEVIATELGAIGLSVCYDSRFPEASRAQALAGAEILICIFAYAADPGVPVDILTHRAIVRAWENNVFYVLCNRVGTQDGITFIGGSVVTGPSGQVLSEPAGDRAGVVRARLTSRAMRDALDLATVVRDRRADVYGDPKPSEGSIRT